MLAAATAAVVVGLLGMLATDIGPWYGSLQRPAWQPPDWAFGPVWTAIYALTTTSAVLGWRAAPDACRRDTWLVLLALNAFLNVLWSLLFFRLRHPDWALVDSALLWVSVLSLVLYPWRWRRAAAWLNVPYLGWVTFATLLNATIVRLNGPFA